MTPNRNAIRDDYDKICLKQRVVKMEYSDVLERSAKVPFLKP